MHIMCYNALQYTERKASVNSGREVLSMLRQLIKCARILAECDRAYTL